MKSLGGSGNEQTSAWSVGRSLVFIGLGATQKLTLAALASLVLLLGGCATTRDPEWRNAYNGSWRLSPAEVKKLPSISIRNILSSASATARDRTRVLVKAPSLDGFAEVRSIPDQEDVIVEGAHGRETRIPITQISEIKSITQYRVEPRQTSSAMKRRGSARFWFIAAHSPFSHVACF